MMFIRTAGASDLPAIRALLTETWHATYDGIYGADKVTAISDDWHSIASLEARLDKPDAEFVVADDGAEIAGMAFASAVDDGKTVQLSQLYVRPGRQGQGIGGLLLDEIIDSFPDAERVRLEVEPANARAITFYRMQGFVEIGRTNNCGGDLSGIAALIMERALV
jgi:ribosomal protein S18 acetylase RimI-like enzyme